MSWDFVAPAWVAAGRALKPEDVSPREAAALGVRKASWDARSYAEKKELAYKFAPLTPRRPVALGCLAAACDGGESGGGRAGFRIWGCMRKKEALM